MRKEEQELADSPKLGTGDLGTRPQHFTPLILLCSPVKGGRLKMPVLPTSGGEGSNIIGLKKKVWKISNIFM